MGEDGEALVWKVTGYMLLSLYLFGIFLALFHITGCIV